MQEAVISQHSISDVTSATAEARKSTTFAGKGGTNIPSLMNPHKKKCRGVNSGEGECFEKNYITTTITGIVYLDMLQHFIIAQLDEEDQEGRIRFQQDDAPPSLSWKTARVPQHPFPRSVDC
jgi:hypothetical protein